jgi:hypothetical protein
MRGEANRSNVAQITAATLSRCAYGFPPTTKGRGKQMSVNTKMAVRETVRDFAVVSSFCFWAVMIGFMPIVAIHALIA